MLTVICNPLLAKTDDNAAYQLWAQVYLLEVLFDQVNERIKLPQRAINSITPVLSGLMDI